MDNFRLEDLEIREIDNSFAKLFIEKHHYTHSCNLAKVSYGFFNNDKIVCVVVFSRPSGKNLSKSIWKDGNDTNTMELIRMFSFDGSPKNTESFCISRCIKEIKKELPNIKVLVSYADSGAGHVGYIYQASNWSFIGQASAERKIFIDGVRQHRRSLYGKYGTSSITSLKSILGDRLAASTERCAKNKYIYVVGQSKSEIKEINSKLLCKSQPYPKGNIARYNDEACLFSKM